MRISTSQLFDRSVQGILDNHSKLSHTQQQLSSGKRILRPSDDPVGATQVLRLTEELQKIEQFKKNNTLLENSLNQEETVLRSATEAANRARQLTIQAENGVNTIEDRRAIAVEIGEIRDQMFDLMNSRNADGEYIFAGFQADSPAFIYDATATGNRYQFQGDDGQNEIQLSNTVKIASGDSGKVVFENVDARLKAAVTGGTATAASLKITQQGAFDRFHSNNFDPVTAPNNVYVGTVNGGGDQIDFVNSGTSLPAGSVNFTNGEPFTFNGVEFTVTGAPGETVEFTLSQPEKDNLAETLNNLFIALNDENIVGDVFSEAISDALVGIDNGLATLANVNAAVGGRLNVSDSVLQSNLDLEISNKQARSEIEDVDYAKAVSELSRQEIALEAAQSTFSRVTRLSLFDFI